MHVQRVPVGDADHTQHRPLAGAAGRTRSLPTARWYEVYLPDGSGWVRSTNLAYVATPRDVTAEAVAGLGAAAGAGTVAELGKAVARAWSAEEPSVRITVPSAVPAAAPGAITVDVTGFADDVRWGERLVVTAAPGPAEGGVVITGVVAQALCRRGVTSDGRCV